MPRNRTAVFLLFFAVSYLASDLWVFGQHETSFAEKFALAEDRREALGELIPGTEEYFFYHCLHFQNELALEQAESILNQWRTKFGDTDQVSKMVARQMMLAYHKNPQRTLKFLRDKLKLNFNHAPPSRDRAAALPTELDNGSFAQEKLIDSLLSKDRSLGQFENSGLPLLLDRKLTPEQLRALIGRLQRVDHPRVVSRIAEELALKDSRGFGWAGAHQKLTLKQLEDLLEDRPQLLENDTFVRSYTARLAPAEGILLTNKAELRKYLDRLLEWARRLPPSQNSFKALVLGNRLRLDLREKKFDRDVFLEYLALPRSAPYYELRPYRGRRVVMAELNYSMNPQVPLPAMRNDSELVLRFLEHFLKRDSSVDVFSKLLKRDYLERVLAETKILYGAGQSKVWYAKLSAIQQRQLRDRVEMRFAPHNADSFAADSDVSLDIELKNVQELIVKIYEINTPAYLRNNARSIGTDIDLDGLVANSQQTLRFSQPAELRHIETLKFPELKGRGVWVIDFLGAGQRSRALIQKGQLIALQRLGDAGHVFEVRDETGAAVPSAHIEMAGRKFAPRDGKIVLPYAEETQSRNILVVDGSFASRTKISHQRESYALQAGFLLDRQSLVAGTQASIAINTRLNCNGQPINIKLLEESQLSVVATDADGIQTSQTVRDLDLDDGDELVHSFLVPQRLARIEFALSGKVFNQSRNERQTVEAKHTVACNGIAKSAQIGDFYLQRLSEGFRLLVLGRNGEALSRLPVTVTLKPQHFKGRKQFSLATDSDGLVRLGSLSNIESLQVSARAIQASDFSPRQFHRSWPAKTHLAENTKLELALGLETADASGFSLYEIRRGVPFENLSNRLQIQNGSLATPDLSAGDYVLRDHESNQAVRIAVADGEKHGQFVVGSGRVLQTGLRQPVIIRNVSVHQGELVVDVDGADALTRVHIVANTFSPTSSLGRQIRLPDPSPSHRSRQWLRSVFVDSLKLDEEYSYILERRKARKFPGNMLPQATLLVHPWEVSVTENESQSAAKGDAMPASQAPADAMQEDAAAKSRLGRRASPEWKSFDFLAEGSVIATNLGLIEGQVRLPAETLGNFSSVTVLAVHPLSSDSRQLQLGEGDFGIRDQRLRSAFDAETKLAQTQRIELLKSGEQKVLGDPKTRRFQSYSSIADVFRLYQTLLDDERWQKFQFVGRWHVLSADEKRRHYNEMACHELNFFLYYKDREFFDQVVRPLVQQKLDKQLVDLWLLGRSLKSYDALWRVQRANVLERILLAQHLESHRPGTERWIEESLDANPISPQTRQSLFEVALRGLALDASASGGSFGTDGFANSDPFGAVAGGGYGGRQSGQQGGAFGGYGMPPSSRNQVYAVPEKPAPAQARGLRRKNEANLALQVQNDLLRENLFEVERKLAESRPFFNSLDKTHEWAETQYHQIRLADQNQDLIRPNPFWQQFLDAGAVPFLPENLETPCGSLNEALCALAVIDLPFDGKPTEVKIENEQLVVTASTPAVLFVESIEASQPSESQAPTILVGQDIYLAQSNSDRPVQKDALLQGIPYRATIVVTNPGNATQEVDVLTQLPAGSLPLAGSKSTRSSSLTLRPYSTAQVQYTFYFPVAGAFEHYGAQVNHREQHLAGTQSVNLDVLKEPESVDESTWEYVADWGTEDQVLDFLRTNNLQKIALSRIAFRMQSADFYQRVVELLGVSGSYDPTLWAFAVKHNDTSNIEQFLQNQPEFFARLGSALDSPLVHVDPQEQMSYEHLDYRPLVVARVHRLGQKYRILNPSMAGQFAQLLDVIAHQAELTDEQRLQLCYYMLLQNRIEDALHWYDQVDAAAIDTRLQYDYMGVFLDFYRGDYPRAVKIAQEYVGYPVPRWDDLFRQVREQVAQRDSMSSGLNSVTLTAADSSVGRDQKLLTEQRDLLQTQRAQQTPVLNLESSDDAILIQYRNIKRVQVNYYLMDIELLFSRRPFVSKTQQTSPVIQPNLRETIELGGEKGARKLELPADLRNKNLLVEVTAEGISKSKVITARSIQVSVMEAYGQLSVTEEQGGGPVERAYVKVYAQHQDGSIRFAKDGYTDLRGQFDYATLSTGDLDTTQRFSILVLHDELGAVVQEAAPPTR